MNNLIFLGNYKYCPVTKITLFQFSGTVFSEALQLVSAAAAHANDAMKRTEKFKKVLEVQVSSRNLRPSSSKRQGSVC